MSTAILIQVAVDGWWVIQHAIYRDNMSKLYLYVCRHSWENTY